MEALVMIGLIDADLIAYRCSVSQDEWGNVAEKMKFLIQELTEQTKCESYKYYLSGSNNFRKQLYHEYKANRTAPKPTHLQSAREWLEVNYLAESVETLEADDLLGMYQDDQTVIISLDKDLLQVIGKHYQWAIEGGPADKRWRKEEKWSDIDEFSALQILYTQILTGDSTDNIKGAKGIGKVKAVEMLENCIDEIEFIDKCLGAYGSEEEFLMNAGCVYVLRHPNDSYLKRYERITDASNNSESKDG